MYSLLSVNVSKLRHSIFLVLIICFCHRSGETSEPADVLVQQESLKQHETETNDKSFVIQVASTDRLIGFVSQEEAVAAYNGYASALAKERGLKVRVESKLFNDLESLRKAIKANELHYVGLITPEYFALENDEKLDLMFTLEKGGEMTVQYVILTHVDLEFDRISNLKDRHLVTIKGFNMGMANIWLDTLLMEEGLPSSEQFFASVVPDPKAVKAILSVFFKKKDACLVTLSAYKTMVELNPQVGEQLRVIAMSSKMVPFVVCLCKNFSGYYRVETIKAFLEADKHLEGQQSLILFQSDRVVPCTKEDLSSTKTLIVEYRKFKNVSDRSIHYEVKKHIFNYDPDEKE